MWVDEKLKTFLFLDGTSPAYDTSTRDIEFSMAANVKIMRRDDEEVCRSFYCVQLSHAAIKLARENLENVARSENL
jgi:hypothetical protein